MSVLKPSHFPRHHCHLSICSNFGWVCQMVNQKQNQITIWVPRSSTLSSRMLDQTVYSSHRLPITRSLSSFFSSRIVSSSRNTVGSVSSILYEKSNIGGASKSWHCQEGGGFWVRTSDPGQDLLEDCVKVPQKVIFDPKKLPSKWSFPPTINHFP